LIYGNWADHQGGGITCDDGAATIINCTIAGNQTRQHSRYSCGLFVGGATVTVTNCTVWDNAPRQIWGMGRVIYSDVLHSWPGLGNMNEEPLFVPGPEGDYYLSQIAAGQTQQSPCVDAGDPLSAIILGTTRTDGVPDSGIVDMGFHYPIPAGVGDLVASAIGGAKLIAHHSSLIIHNSPNPFNATTVASYELRVASHVSLQVYDTAGRLVQTLVDGWREAGSHEVTFDASSLPSGVYVARLQAGILSATQKLVLMK
jgi:hypothetical protein